MERIARLPLDEREVRIGDMRVLYCATRRRTGEWFALGNLIDEGVASGRRARLVSGCGATERNAIESMLRRAGERSSAGAALKPR